MEWDNQNLDNKFLFYDNEIFCKDALIVFMDINSNVVAEYHLSPDTQGNPFAPIRGLIQDKILVGYNNYHYDDYILTLMLGNNPDNETLKTANDAIISGETTKFVRHLDKDILSLDAFQQISVAKSGLKKVEANIGMSIEETPQDFERTTQLSNDELEQVFEYCRHDVRATIKVFKLRWNTYFVPKFKVLSMLPEELAMRALRWNTTTITQTFLMGSSNASTKIFTSAPPGGYIDFSKYPFLPDHVIEMWTDEERKTKKTTVTEYGVNFEFGFGGLHGAPVHELKTYYHVKLLDVASMYPSLLIQFNALGKSTDKYKEIVDRRLKIKHVDPIESNALKLVINSTYGLMRPEYSRIRNCDGADAICFMGQIVLFDLCERLYKAGYKLINVNTDGVAFNGTDDETYKEIWHEWEEDYGLTLELSKFYKWIQKDVNNYIAVTYDDKIKVKGADVKKYHDTVDFNINPYFASGDSWNNTNTCAIISKAVVDNLVFDKDIIDTLYENLDHPILYQFILQAGRTYEGNIDSNENTDYQRINRVFAVKETYEDPPIFKYKLDTDDDGNSRILTTRYPDSPEHMKIVNSDVSEITDFEKMIDLNYYNRLCEKVRDRWL